MCVCVCVCVCVCLCVCVCVCVCLCVCVCVCVCVCIENVNCRKGCITSWLGGGYKPEVLSHRDLRLTVGMQ